MDCPSCATDLKPIENVWQRLTKHVHKKYLVHGNITEGKGVISKEIESSIVSFIKKLSDSMKTRQGPGEFDILSIYKILKIS